MWKIIARSLGRNKEFTRRYQLEHSQILLSMASGFSNQNMSNTATINIGQGTLRGKEETTKEGFKYFSFRGIPYAKPPIGPLRFRAPQPPEPWSGVRDAFEEGNPCPQLDEVFSLYKGDVDCLYLNIFTPKNPNKKESLKPVMVWIHGGGFGRGSSTSEIYGPDHLVAEDVVIVSFNYRLGPFGFLCLDNEDVPGNAGLKDQVMALRWVQKNIENFGGNPNKVTIFGESAGGASVHYHILSSMSKGLFHQAISQSGSVLNSWAFTESAKERSFRLGKALGCTTNDPDELHKFLQNVSAQDIVKLSLESVSPQEKQKMVLFPFVPCIEKVKGSGGVFLGSHPFELIQAGKFQRVPLIIGANSQEGLISLPGLKESKLAKIDRDPQGFIPADLSVEIDTDLARNIGKRIKDIYFGKECVSTKTIAQYANVISSSWFTYGIFKTIQMHSALSTTPIYYYKFNFDGKLGLFKRLLGLHEHKGVCHADDIGYLFEVTMASFEVDPDSPESKIRSRFVKLWTNFAKTGNPTPEKTALLDVIWRPVERNRIHRLNIDEQLTMEECYEDKYFKFWDSVYDGARAQKGKL